MDNTKIVKKEIDTLTAPGKLQSIENVLPSPPSPTDREIVEASYAFIIIKGR